MLESHCLKKAYWDPAISVAVLAANAEVIITV
jgi:hypothetical protein